MIHGFSKQDKNGNWILVFNTGNVPVALSAPCISKVTQQPLRLLIEAHENDEVVGYSLRKPNDCHGLLFYSREAAEKQLAEFKHIFTDEYVCTPLKVSEL